MLANLAALIRLGQIHPGLVPLVISLRRRRRTFLSVRRLASLAQNFNLVRRRHSGPVQVAEFGVGRGGSATLLAWMVSRAGGNLHLYDVFGRIPPPSQQDGAPAQERYRIILAQESGEYYGNLSNLEELIRADLRAVIPLEQVEFVAGRYEETLPRRPVDPSYDLVHVDCDWYESSKAVLQYLEGNLSPGAILQIDDYTKWQGSRQAVDEANWLQTYRRKLVDGALVIDTSSIK